VIVFTHDLVFMEALRAAAAKDQVPMVSHWLIRGSDNRPGVIKVGEDPWQLRKVRTRVGDLRATQARLARAQDRTTDEYRDAVTAYYGGLRETWERLVEELLPERRCFEIPVGSRDTKPKGGGRRRPGLCDDVPRDGSRFYILGSRHGCRSPRWPALAGGNAY
jgi:hypothetical protein